MKLTSIWPLSLLAKQDGPAAETGLVEQRFSGVVLSYKEVGVACPLPGSALRRTFGFIRPDGQAHSMDVFVDQADVRQSGLPELEEGQRVTYRVVKDKGKSRAAALAVVK